MAETDPKKVGSWEAPFTVDNVAVHATLLPNGLILCWGRRSDPMSMDEATMNEQKTVPFLLDPQIKTCKRTKGRPTRPGTPANPTKGVDVNIFCSGHCHLPDGNVFVVGGHIVDGDGAKLTFVYDWRNDDWIFKTEPNAGRWYPSALALADGSVFTISGSHKPNNQWTVNNIPQVWRQNPNISPPKVQDEYLTVRPPPAESLLYPRLFLMPTGEIFVAGSQARSQILTVDTSLTKVPNAAAIKDSIGDWNLDRTMKIPERQAGERQYGSSALYDSGKVIWTAGGNDAQFDNNGKVIIVDGTPTGPPTDRVEIIDLNKSPLEWRPATKMGIPRRHHNATTLPDGTVLVTGGTRGAGFNNIGDKMPVHTPELWNPENDTWTKMADETSDRCYHANALLLPNGKVLSTGGGEGGVAWSQLNPAKSNLTNAQLFSPPYLAEGDKSRPKVSGMPPLNSGKSIAVEYGQEIPVTIEGNDAIARVSWIRLGSVTHAMNMSQGVWFQRMSPPVKKQLTVKVPENANVLPPGHYMVFFVNSAGVPSIAPIVQILPKPTRPLPKAQNMEAAIVEPAVSSVSSRRMAVTLPEADKHMEAQQNRPHVTIGVIPVCPYGLGPCWGGAAEGLNAIDHVEAVRPVPDQDNSLAFVYLTDDNILPDIDLWRSQFAKTANGSYGIRGIELTLTGVVAKVATKGTTGSVLALTNAKAGWSVTLAPFKQSSQIRWDMATQTPKAVTDGELGAYAALGAAIDSSGEANVQVTGRLNMSDATSYSLDVREFKIASSAA
jgi:galactose oxidase